MNSLWTSYSIVAICGILGFWGTIQTVPSPEEQILGQWKELKWEYEKVDKTEADSINYKHIPDDVKHLIGQNLIIHKAETWVFLPGRKVKLIGDGQEKTVLWRIRGRGNILQFKYDNDTVENYNLTELTEDRMILNFESDMQVRGIAKLTFIKDRNN